MRVRVTLTHDPTSLSKLMQMEETAASLHLRDRDPNPCPSPNPRNRDRDRDRDRDKDRDRGTSNVMSTSVASLISHSHHQYCASMLSSTMQVVAQELVRVKVEVGGWD